MLMAILIALLVAVVVKLVLSQFATTAPYADVIAVVVGILVFIGRL